MDYRRMFSFAHGICSLLVRNIFLVCMATYFLGSEGISTSCSNSTTIDSPFLFFEPYFVDRRFELGLP